jgi:hypothetical protein
MAFRLLTAGFLAAIFLSAASAAEPVADKEGEGIAFFEAKIRPVLVKHCYECHSTSSGNSEGDLKVDTREAIRTGGGRGPAVVPGDPAASWLLTAASHADPDLKMPPKKERLPDAVIADLKQWIQMGAPDPRDGDVAAASAKGRLEFWARERPKDSPPPAVKDQAWPKRGVDQFVLAKLEELGLAPSVDASPEVILRRLHFDLVGLPPSPEAIERFEKRILSDGIDAAIAAEADELLSTPQFGERWGRHWLDVARFAESSGKEANISFPYAFRYRDYVIDSVNADVPFNRFVVEQVAGDLLPFADDAERARLLIATGFLALGPKNLDEGNEKQFWADLVDEQIDAVTRAVLANSVACARCHDHKFDPFSMQDYYALAGVFASTKTYFGTAISPSNRMGGDPLRLPEGAKQPVFHESISEKRVVELKNQLAALKKEQEDGMAAVMKAALEGKDTSEIFTLRDALRIFWTSGGIEGQLEKVSEKGEALPLAMGVQDREKIIDAPLLERGDVAKPKDPVPRAIPEFLRFDNCDPIPADHSGRLELAHWLTHPDQPLTSRVIVNRVWHHLFGAGLVRTVDNFGSTGERPSHPELLDHLAVKFVDSNWSLKQLVRELVLTRTYRQDSAYRKDGFHADPDNRLLWRATQRRIDAESIRDAMLAASGELDLKRPQGSLVANVIGDRPISLIGLDKRLPTDLDGSVTRSVYLPVIRDRLPDVLELFDFAEPSLVTGERESTNVPIQALYMMNSSWVQERATAFAARLLRDGETDDQRVRLAFQLCFGREPSRDETDRSLAYLAEQASSEAGASSGPAPRLISFCQALLSTSEFRNLD